MNVYPSAPPWAAMPVIWRAMADHIALADIAAHYGTTVGMLDLAVHQWCCRGRPGLHAPVD